MGTPTHLQGSKVQRKRRNQTTNPQEQRTQKKKLSKREGGNRGRQTDALQTAIAKPEFPVEKKNGKRGGRKGTARPA